jgi:hypothetical protein
MIKWYNNSVHVYSYKHFRLKLKISNINISTVPDIVLLRVSLNTYKPYMFLIQKNIEM